MSHKAKKIPRDLPVQVDKAADEYNPLSHWCDLGDYCDQRRREPPYTGANCVTPLNPQRHQLNWAVTAPEGMHLVEDEYALAQEAIAGLGEGDPEADKVADIKEWWIRTASDDSIAVAEKYREYGATSLSDMGYELAELLGWQRPTKGQAQQLAVYFFLKGKMARLKTAILKGETASDDTWLDITCYAMIARKARASGAWPNGGA